MGKNSFWPAAARGPRNPPSDEFSPVDQPMNNCHATFHTILPTSSFFFSALVVACSRSVLQLLDVFFPCLVNHKRPSNQKNGTWQRPFRNKCIVRNPLIRRVQISTTLSCAHIRPWSAAIRPIRSQRNVPDSEGCYLFHGRVNQVIDRKSPR